MVRHEREASAGGCLIAFGLIFALFGGGIGAVAFADAGIIPALFCSIFVLVGLAIVGAGIHQLMGQSLFRDLYLETPEKHTLLGQRVRWRVGFTAGKSFRVDTVTVTHCLEEKAILRRGTNSTTYSKNLFEQEKVFEVHQDFRAGESHVLEGEFKMPADGPSTFDAGNNSLIYRMAVTMDVPNWPDPSCSWPITMKPILSSDAFEGKDEDAEAGGMESFA